MSQSILITGGTGFIGRVLCSKLLAKNYDVTVLSRQSLADVKSICGSVHVVGSLDDLRGHSGFYGVINLAGEGIAEKRWSSGRKKALRESRIDLTKTLVEVARTWAVPPRAFVSGSAVGYYGNQGQNPVDEHTPPNDEFTHRLCADWEQAALTMESPDTRVCLSRTGVVTGRNGGFLQRMLPPFKAGLGGRLGSGDQYMPWVHREDVANALIWMLETPSASGAYNVVSPHPVTNKVFTRTLAGVLHRPALFPAPAAVLKIAFGEMARLLLTGQQARPVRLLEEGFEFSYPELRPALEDSVK